MKSRAILDVGLGCWALLNVGLGCRVLQKLDMDAEYKGNVEATGEDAEYEGNVEVTGENAEMRAMSRPRERIIRRSQQISGGDCRSSI